ncbi:TnsD family Tn7-like transposition protein [Undibacterium arcticum]|uniref:TnsD family Tn7-like transposition protein n=1 Tax=Undibacterium arcticum TaxID=1762892 RepID=UPI00361F4980
MDGEATIPRLHFFPSRLPDETLHSRVSRLHTLSGNLDDRHTLQDAFGSHTLVATSHLPSHLNALSSRLPDALCASAEDFLEQSTLFPYFRPFLQPAQVENCRAAMCSNNAGEVKVAIGLVASRIGGRNALRFYRQCCIEDALRYGVAYWHRTHQLPGAWLCVDHGEPLVEVHASWLRSHRHNLFLPMPEQFSGCSSEHSIRASHAACLSKCAALSVELLGSNQTPLDPGVLRSFYRDCATQQGWIDAHGRICAAAVHRSAMEFCGQWPLDQDFRFIQDEHWIFKLLHKHRGSMHPLKHVAMLICSGATGVVCLVTAGLAARRPHRFRHSGREFVLPPRQ